MLKSFRKNAQNRSSNAIALSEDDDLTLRLGLGRFARQEHLEAARATVIALADRERWLRCDCSKEQQPIMVPVRGERATLRRQDSSADHDPECDFARPPGYQRRINRSLSRVEGNINLGSRRARPPSRPRGIRQWHSHSGEKRSKLARLLMTLIDRAALNRLELPRRVRDQASAKLVWRRSLSLNDQFTAIRSAARTIEVCPGIQASRFLKTSPAYFNDLKDSLLQSRDEFGDYIPFGLMLFIASHTDGNEIFPVGDGRCPIPCENASVRVFGEEPRTVGQTARSPYIALCLISENASGDGMEVVRAYLHPCLHKGSLFPVDSNAERSTFMVIDKACEWVTGKQQCLTFNLEKPLFSLPSVETEEDDAEDDEAETCAFACIPDFILHCTRDGRQNDLLRIIVETMGFENDQNYSARKERTHPEMMARTETSHLLPHHPLREDPEREASRLIRWIGGIALKWAQNG